MTTAYDVGPWWGRPSCGTALRRAARRGSSCSARSRSPHSSPSSRFRIPARFRPTRPAGDTLLDLDTAAEPPPTADRRTSRSSMLVTRLTSSGWRSCSPRRRPRSSDTRSARRRNWRRPRSWSSSSPRSPRSRRRRARGDRADTAGVLHDQCPVDAGRAGARWVDEQLVLPRRSRLRRRGTAGEVVIANAGESALEARVTLFAGPGEDVELEVTVPPHERSVVDVDAAVGADFVSAMVEIDGGGGLVEQAATHPEGTSVAPCANAPASSWYLAEGFTAEGSVEQLILTNPYDESAIVSIGFATEEGSREPAELQGYPVPARSVKVIDLRQHRGAGRTGGCGQGRRQSRQPGRRSSAGVRGRRPARIRREPRLAGAARPVVVRQRREGPGRPGALQHLQPDGRGRRRHRGPSRHPTHRRARHDRSDHGPGPPGGHVLARRRRRASRRPSTRWCSVPVPASRSSSSRR